MLTTIHPKSPAAKYCPKQSRRGIVATLLAILLPLILVIVIFVVDYGALLVAQQQLQAAADSSAKAGIDALQSDRDIAAEVAIATAAGNHVLDKSVKVDTSDVTFGNWDSDAKVFVPVSSIDDGPTAVRVNLELSRERESAVRLWFASFLGIQSAEVRAEAIAAYSAGCSGFVGLDSVRLENQALTGSFNSDDGRYGPRGENGDICSNGDVTMASGADVYGDVGHGSGSRFDPGYGSGTTVTGNVSALASPIVRDPVDFSAAEDSNDNDTIERGPVWAPPFYNGNDLVVNNGRSITFQSGTYYFRNVNLAGGSTMKINGQVNMYVTGQLRFDNGTLANLSAKPSNFRIFVGSGPVNIQGGHELHAVLYAPQADVSIGNGSGFFGSIVGRTLRATGGIGLYFDESLADSEASGGPGLLVR